MEFNNLNINIWKKVLLFGAILSFGCLIELTRSNKLNASFKIEHVQSGKCLDVANNRALNLLIYDCRPNSESQLWTLLDGDKLVNKKFSAMCINHIGHEEVFLGPCNYKSAFEPISGQIDTEFSLRFKNSSNCLNSRQGFNYNLNRIIAESCFRFLDFRQSFKIKPEKFTTNSTSL